MAEMQQPWFKRTIREEYLTKHSKHNKIAIPFFICGGVLCFIALSIFISGGVDIEGEQVAVPPAVGVVFLILGLAALVFAIVWINLGKKNALKVAEDLTKHDGLKLKYENNYKRIDAIITGNNYTFMRQFIEYLLNRGFTLTSFTYVTHKNEEQEFHLIFDTELSDEELIEQDNRITKSLNGESLNMPDYYVEGERLHAKKVDETYGRSVGKRWKEKVETYVGDKLIKTDINSYHESIHSFYFCVLLVYKGTDDPFIAAETGPVYYETPVTISLDVKD